MTVHPASRMETWEKNAGKTFSGPQPHQSGFRAGLEHQEKPECDQELRQGPSLKGRAMMEDSRGLAVFYTQACHTQADGSRHESRPWQEDLHLYTHGPPQSGWAPGRLLKVHSGTGLGTVIQQQ